MLRNTQFGMSGPVQPAKATGGSFEVLNSAPRVVLAVTPHPDDCEGGCGGAIARWVNEFDTQAIVLMCTNGNKGTQERDLAPEKLAAIREKEQLEAAKITGVKDVVFLRHPDGGLEDTMLFRSQVVREIRRYKPDVILCIDPYRSASHTHRDHRMSGQVALDAAFTYAWSYQHFPEQIIDQGLEPHMVEQAYLWGSESPDVFVEIGNYLEAKTLSLEAHASQMSPATTDERFSRISNNAARYRELTGVEHTEAFRRIRFGLGSAEWQFLYS